MNKFLRNIFILITSFILLSAISIISILWTYSNDLPDYNTVIGDSLINNELIPVFAPSINADAYNGFVTPFANNIRALTGAAPDEYVNIHEISPDQMSLDLFAATDLISNNLVGYYGMTYTGEEYNGTFSK